MSLRIRMVVVTAFILSEADSKHWIFKESLENCQHLDLKIGRLALQRAQKWKLLDAGLSQA